MQHGGCVLILPDAPMSEPPLPEAAPFDQPGNAPHRPIQMPLATAVVQPDNRLQ
jgi:hypothetical protein